MWFEAVKMSLSELQRRNKIVKFCLQNPNKSKNETAEYFKLLRPFKFLTQNFFSVLQM
jgi:hypothetical protein